MPFGFLQHQPQKERREGKGKEKGGVREVEKEDGMERKGREGKERGREKRRAEGREGPGGKERGG